ncbi:hypothetical protein HWV00_11700 [Moritella sp. 24]|uniref:hypothetical protein n=1 Tax=Moritella sp. 24 TaxID=2746230 RepID=UPI001BA8EA7D|nr:hypothetical protein [Moritella sp. 24]QUM76847.1 hypothetical protein HWV00_11700 [Moritella sp. 24]
MKNPKADACSYLMTMILQRLEHYDEGFINNLVEGVEADRSALPKTFQSKPHVEAIFRETYKILDHAKSNVEYKKESEGVNTN